jgi:molybdopterin-guanine dinucleotide biosynthesis protein A
MNPSPPPLPFTAVLLAGGRSTRMGRDKAGIVLDGQPLWQRQLATLRATAPRELWISGHPDGPYAGAGVEVVPDDAPGLGPLGGIVTALRRMQCERLLVLAIDLPAMTPVFLRGLLGTSGVVPILDGRFEPLAAVYPRSIRTLAEECLATQERSMQRFVRAGIDRRLLIPHAVSEDERPLFRNVNSPSDLDGR